MSWHTRLLDTNAPIAILLPRLAAVPLIAVMLVAIASTKVLVLMNEGFWAMAHAIRTDFLLLCFCSFC